MTIDVHSHTVPKIYADALRVSSARNIKGFSLCDWSVEDHLEMMDGHMIQACVLSISSTGLRFADSDLAVNLARAVNIEHAGIIGAHPSRFGAFALLPMPNVVASLKEIAYALDVLKLDGVGLYTNYEGVYLGDKKFAPVLDELHRRKAVVFVHPTSPPHGEELTFGYPASMLEYPFDSTRAILSLLDTDTLERCNHIRFIICHGGSALALLMPQIGPMMQLKKGGNKLSLYINTMRVEREIRSLFFDLAASTCPAFLAALREDHDPSRLLMGFDFPFMPAIAIYPALKAVQSCDSLSEKEKKAIDRSNAEELFPRLAHAIARVMDSRQAAYKK